MARRTGGRLDLATGRVSKGRMPKGSTDDPATFRENQIARVAGDAASAAGRALFRAVTGRRF
ncbi:hypothetical protein Aca07nite_49150 [Actinoplanes capillaceus]|uniref:Uncharacterized protein n=1 Tax=Actinoplanes campanulatus TaxID=113559 RepID=A0ABQ3WN72_9ACTN|nr:hypothetical protein [Actinoplanes capillaceus]GID47640.1 hypothetical protein Aca07nite_49150 [Actinoplanes capillaceus]